MNEDVSYVMVEQEPSNGHTYLTYMLREALPSQKKKKKKRKKLPENPKVNLLPEIGYMVV